VEKREQKEISVERRNELLRTEVRVVVVFGQCCVGFIQLLSQSYCVALGAQDIIKVSAALTDSLREGEEEAEK